MKPTEHTVQTDRRRSLRPHSRPARASRSSVTPNRSQSHRHQVRFGEQSQSRPRNSPSPTGRVPRPPWSAEAADGAAPCTGRHVPRTRPVIQRLTSHAQKRPTDPSRHSHELQERGLSRHRLSCSLPSCGGGGRASTWCPRGEGERGERCVFGHLKPRRGTPRARGPVAARAQSGPRCRGRAQTNTQPPSHKASASRILRLSQKCPSHLMQ